MSREREALLDALMSHTGEWVAPVGLAERLGLDAPALDPLVAELRAEGYAIASRAGGGYRLTGWDDRLIAREIRRGLAARTIGRRVTVLPATTSTNEVAWREALGDADEGAVIVAEEQSAGRGRMGRQWHCPPGAGLLFSVILRPAIDPQLNAMLTAMASVAVAQSLRDQLELPARIRWPNDIVLHDRKVAGILVEGRTLATGAAFVAGIGVNVNLTEADFPLELKSIATSLCIETGHRVSRLETLRALLESLERWYRDLASGDVGRIANRWRQLSSTLGRRVVLTEDGVEFRGTVLDLSMEDGLIVRLDGGVTRIFHPARVTLRDAP